MRASAPMVEKRPEANAASEGLGQAPKEDTGCGQITPLKSGLTPASY